MFAEIWSYPLELVQFFIASVCSVKTASKISVSSWHLLFFKFNYKIIAIIGLFLSWVNVCLSKNYSHFWRWNQCFQGTSVSCNDTSFQSAKNKQTIPRSTLEVFKPHPRRELYPLNEQNIHGWIIATWIHSLINGIEMIFILKPQ